MSARDGGEGTPRASRPEAGSGGSSGGEGGQHGGGRRGGRHGDQRSSRQDGEESGQQGQQGQQGGSGGSGGQQGGSQREGPSRTEWVVGILSTLLVLALLGFLVHEAVQGTDLPPIVTVEVVRVLPTSSGYVVEIRARNDGGTTARALSVSGTLEADTGTVERSTTTISFVPARAEREGGLFFSKDPREYRLEVRPEGYDRP